MKMLAFARRNALEILRDKLNFIFGIGFPVILLLLLSLIQSNIPVSLFEIGHLVPGIVVFGFSFLALFSGTLIAKDRSGAFIVRLMISPMKSADYILGYTLPLLPMGLAQALACYILALLLGLPLNANILLAMLTALPSAVFFIAIGLLCGSCLQDKQVGGVCGALLTNLTAWLSGTWFDTSLVGGFFETIANVLPFSHAVNAGRCALSGDFSQIFGHLIWVCIYAIVALCAAVWAFRRRLGADTP